MSNSSFENFVRTNWRGGGGERVMPSINDSEEVAILKRRIDQLRQLYIMSLGLGGETGEVLELLKKYERDGKQIEPDLALELGDVLHYLTRIATEFRMPLDMLQALNKDKLLRRRTTGVKDKAADIALANEYLQHWPTLPMKGQQ